MATKKAPSKKTTTKKTPVKKAEVEKAQVTETPAAPPAPAPEPAPAPRAAKVRPKTKAKCTECGRTLNASNEPHVGGKCGICVPPVRQQRTVVRRQP